MGRRTGGCPAVALVCSLDELADGEDGDGEVEEEVQDGAVLVGAATQLAVPVHPPRPVQSARALGTRQPAKLRGRLARSVPAAGVAGRDGRRWRAARGRLVLRAVHVVTGRRLGLPHLQRAVQRLRRPAPRASGSQIPARTSVIAASRSARLEGGRVRRAQYVLGAILMPCADRARQIGTTPKRSRWASMNSHVSGVAGRAPARRNLWPPSGSRWCAPARSPCA